MLRAEIEVCKKGGVSTSKHPDFGGRLMSNPKRTYKNAGAQTTQGWLEARTFWDAPDADLFTVKGISLVLGINRNAVKQIPVPRIMIDKRGYYRKGDIRGWMEVDLQQPDSLLRKLQAEQDKATERKRTQPSRRYISGQLNKEESRQVREQAMNNRDKAPDSYEAWRFPFLLFATRPKKK
jgi:hypothetical protein